MNFSEYPVVSTHAHFQWIRSRRLSDWLAESDTARNLDTDCLFILISGSITWNIEGQIISSRSGEALAALEGVRIQGSSPDMEGAEGWVIATQLYGMQDEESAGPELHPQFWTLPSTDKFQLASLTAETLSELNDEWLGNFSGSFGQIVRRQRLLYTIIEAFYLQTAQEQEQDTEQGLLRSLTRIQHNYADSLTRDQLADIAGLSPWHYSRKFHEYTGMPPLHYLSAYRIYRAQEHLLTSTLRTREIAARVGFEDASYFSRRFKKRVGCSPRDYAATVASRRICVTSARCAEILIDLGMPPHSVSLTPELVPEEQLQRFARHQVRIIRAPQHSLPIDAIRDARPELLICGPTDEYTLNQLRALTPTFVRISPDLMQTTENMARLLNREKEAAELFHRMERKSQAAKKELAHSLDPQAVVMVLRVERTGYRYLGAHSNGASQILYRELGLSIPPALESGAAWFNPFTLERLAEINPDYLFVENRLTEAGSSDENMQRLLAHSAWAKLDAVRNQRVYAADTKLWAAGLGTTGHFTLIDYVVDCLSEKNTSFHHTSAQ